MIHSNGEFSWVYRVEARLGRARVSNLNFGLARLLWREFELVLVSFIKCTDPSKLVIQFLARSASANQNFNLKISI